MDNSLYDITYQSSGLELTTTTADPAAAIAFMVSGMAVMLIPLFIGAYIFVSIFLSMLFKKAGVASWKAWVPVLNGWKLLEIGGQPGFWSILSIIPIVNMVSTVFTLIAMHNINLKLRYDAIMTVLAIVFSPVWFIVVGTSKHAWDDSLGAPRVDKPDFQPAGGAPAPVAPAPVGPAPTPYAAPTPAAYAAPAPTEVQPPINPDVQPQPSAPADEQPQPPVSQQ